jgi:Kinesin motor domain
LGFPTNPHYLCEGQASCSNYVDVDHQDAKAAVFCNLYDTTTTQPATTNFIILIKEDLFLEIERSKVMQGSSKNTLNKTQEQTQSQQPPKKQRKDNLDGSGAAAVSKNVRVVGRIRPLAKYEIENGSKPCVTKIPSLNDGGPETLQINEGEKRWFELDAILDSESTQHDVYEKSGARKAISEDIFQGFNCTILAYGQTGAGMCVCDMCACFLPSQITILQTFFD